jgi:hypothetical protein
MFYQLRIENMAGIKCFDDFLLHLSNIKEGRNALVVGAVHPRNREGCLANNPGSPWCGIAFHGCNTCL